MKNMAFMVATLLTAVSCQRVAGTSALEEAAGGQTLSTTTDNKRKHGLLKVGGKQCNAFLIASDLIVSALPCTGDDPLAFVGFQFIHEAEGAINVVDIAFLDDKKELVMYRIDRSFDEYYDLGVFDPGVTAKIFAFDTQAGRFVSDSCSLQEVAGNKGILEHHCRTQIGFEGAPLIQGDRLVGFHISGAPASPHKYALDLAALFDDDVDLAKMDTILRGGLGHVRMPHVRSQHIRAPAPTCLIYQPTPQYAQFRSALNRAKSEGVLHDRHDCLNMGTGSSAAISVISYLGDWATGMGSIVAYFGTNAVKCACEEVF